MRDLNGRQHVDFVTAVHVVDIDLVSLQRRNIFSQSHVNVSLQGAEEVIELNDLSCFADVPR